ncbi:MAG: hypothetical protein JXP34_28930, partial [Planctomycetes bacterium]|nr:hypothetical protein [Planctomycetota bacterium]
MTDNGSVSSPPQALPQPDQGEERPLGLPAGSVRAIIALSLCAGVWLCILRGLEIPESLRDILLAVLGYYFARRACVVDAPPASSPSPRRRFAPLYLPRGSVRVILVLGFAAVIAAIFVRKIPVPAGNVLLLALVGSFLAGQIARRVCPRRGVVIEHLRDLKAIAVLIAA